MSLLMDALKKAEQEKREAAERLAQARAEEAAGDVADEAGQATGADSKKAKPVSASTTGRFASTLELSLEPISQAASAGDQPVTDPASRTADDLPLAPGDETQDVSAAALDIEPPAAAEPMVTDGADADATMTEELREAAAETTPDPDQTFHGIALETTEAIPGLYEETVQGEPYMPGQESGRSYDETLPGVPAVQLAKDIGTADQPTPVAAQTVFTAGHTTGQPTSGLKIVLISLSVLVILAAVIGSYVWITPLSRDVPSPWVAQGIETLVPPNVEDFTPPPTLPAATTTTAAANEPESAPAVSGTGTVAAMEADAVGPGSGEEMLPVSVPAAADQPAPPAPIPAAATAVADVTQSTLPESLPEVIELAPALIKISRRKSTSEKSTIIRTAYAAYQRGDFASAGQAYRRALENYPDNIDALLGLGAIALMQGDVQRAMTLHMRVLQLDPGNHIARAVLVNMQSNADPEERESLLKTMIATNPDQAYLYFALGNVYAVQRRWPEAQQAFFEAYTNDSANANYALNLAVSLDRLGQKSTALDYYQVALSLVDDGAPAFDTATVMRRVQTFTGGTQP